MKFGSHPHKLTHTGTMAQIVFMAISSALATFYFMLAPEQGLYWGIGGIWLITAIVSLLAIRWRLQSLYLQGVIDTYDKRRQQHHDAIWN